MIITSIHGSTTCLIKKKPNLQNLTKTTTCQWRFSILGYILVLLWFLVLIHSVCFCFRSSAINNIWHNKKLSGTCEFTSILRLSFCEVLDTDMTWQTLLFHFLYLKTGVTTVKGEMVITLLNNLPKPSFCKRLMSLKCFLFGFLFVSNE